jgi:uncharacterized damage-inducible protein DinB
VTTLHDLLKARFNMVRQDFAEVLDQLSDEELAWVPADGMRSIAGQLFEIAGKEIEGVQWIRTGAWPDEFDESEVPETLAGWRNLFADLRAGTFAYLDSLDEVDLNQPIICPEGWWEALRLTSCPRHEAFRNIAMHEWYHTGQLVTYLGMKGSDHYRLD